MKITLSLIVLFTVLCVCISSAAETNSNYPLYALENVVAYEVSNEANTLFAIEVTDAGTTFVSRDIATGEIFQTVALKLPQTFFMNTVIFDGSIYIFQGRILDREKRLMETSVYKLKTKDGQLDKVYESQEMLGFAERFYATKTGLLLTEKRGNNPFMYDCNTNEMTAIKLGDDLRIRSFDVGRNSAVIIRQSNFDTHFEGGGQYSKYTEGDGSLLDVYACDFSEDYKLEKVGQYQPSYVISKKVDETSLPHFIIENSDYAWVEPSFMVNRYPIYPGALIGDPALYDTWKSLAGHERITQITMVDDHYAIGSQFSELGETSLVVFDLKNPVLSKAETVAESDRDQIQNLLTKDIEIEKRALDPEVMAQIFAARFYEVDLVTTTVDSSDGGIMTMTSTEGFLAVGMDGNYSVLKSNEELVPLVHENFVLNAQSAPLFQDALDLLFPLGHFAKKHKMFYEDDQRWIFVRDESFGEKVGIVVDVGPQGAIVGIADENEVSKEE